MTDFLTRPLTLWVLFFTTIIISFTLSLISPYIGETVIDMVADPQAVSALIANMSDQQKQLQLWTTLLLDTAYPLAYGAFFIGMALSYFGRWKRWLALPGLAAVVADLAENAVQVLALVGVEELLWLKALLTPAKFYLILLAAVIAVSGLVAAYYNRLLQTAQ